MEGEQWIFWRESQVKACYCPDPEAREIYIDRILEVCMQKILPIFEDLFIYACTQVSLHELIHQILNRDRLYADHSMVEKITKEMLRDTIL